MEDRPPFVVRKVDSRLFSRTPSLFREYAKRAYCCKSPHRYSKCAACRMDGELHSPTCIRRKYASARDRRSRESASNRTDAQMKDQSLTGGHLHIVTNSDDEQQTRNERENFQPLPSIEIPRQNPDQRTSSVSPPLLRVGEWKELSPTRTSLLESQLFNKPTFQERFGHLPFDNVKHHTDGTDALKTARHRPTVLQDQGQQTERGFECYYYDKPYMSPACQHWRDCRCTHDLPYIYNCSCPYCPSYWKYRLSSPPGHSHWKAFNYGLAGYYDDLYLHSVHQ